MRLFQRLLLVLVMCLPAIALLGSGIAKVPSPPSDCSGARPGAHIQTSLGSGGTLNFLFRGSDGHRYGATAGDLFTDEEAMVWRQGGPDVTISDGTTIGGAVFAWNYN